MSELRWTDHVPDEPGFYWYRAPASYGDPCIVHVAEHDGVLRAFFAGMDVPVPLAMLRNTQWAGPIPRPAAAP